MHIDDFVLFLEFDQGDCPLINWDPTYHVYSVRGVIQAVDESDERIAAGKFQLLYLDICAALNAGSSIFDMFDSSSTTLDYFDAIFDLDTLDYSEQFLRVFKSQYPDWGNVLILDRLEILPEFRRHGLGLVVMRRLIERFGAGAGVVAIKPFPLQCERHPVDDDEWRERLRLGDLPKVSRLATAKLKRYYAKLGFKAMKGTPFMFLLPGYPLPSVDELLQ